MKKYEAPILKADIINIEDVIADSTVNSAPSLFTPVTSGTVDTVLEASLFTEE